MKKYLICEFSVGHRLWSSCFAWPVEQKAPDPLGWPPVSTQMKPNEMRGFQDGNVDHRKKLQEKSQENPYFPSILG